MELPATYYGKLDKRNPVILAFDRDVNSLTAVMRRVASSSSRDNVSYVKGIKILVEIRIKFKPRLPLNFYQERMLDIADFLFGIKFYQLALWHGYSLTLLQFSSVEITTIKDVDHFMTCFFPEGIDMDQDILKIKVRAMQGCALCLFEQEKKHSILSQKGLCKLLCLLNFLQIMMQAFQEHEHLCWIIYNGSIHIYSICHYLMTMNCSAQALEYLLWASVSLELSIPLMSSKNLSWIVSLYCAVCICYCNIQAEVQAEEFARRALGKIDALMKMEEQNEVPATKEAQRVYREASIKLAALIFKRMVFESKRRPKTTVRDKAKSTLKDIRNAPWPCTTTERLLLGLFDSSAAHFFGILEALWENSKRPLESGLPDKLELHDVIQELLLAGIRLLSEISTTSETLSLNPTPTLMDLAISGENKVPVMSAVKFMKLLFQYKQPETFSELSRDMLQVLSSVEGQPYRKAELELTLLQHFNNLLSSQRSDLTGDNITDADRHKSLVPMCDEFTDLVDSLHKSVCETSLELQPDGDLVLDAIIYIWDKVKAVFQRVEQYPHITQYNEKVDDYDKWLWCLSLLCEVAFTCDLVTHDCLMMAEMIHTLATQLESVAELCDQKQHPAACESHSNDGKKKKSFSVHKGSSTELLKKVCSVVKRGLGALEKGVVTLQPTDCSAITDSAFMQRFSPDSSSSPSQSFKQEESKREEEGRNTKTESDIEVCQHSQSSRMYLQIKDFHHEMNIIHHRASLKLLQQNAVEEHELLDRVKKNKVAKALYLIQKAAVVYNKEPNNSKTKSLLEEASTLMEKAILEEKKLYLSTIPKTLPENNEKGIQEEAERPPPPPILLSRTDSSFNFAPAPYKSEGQVFWYQLCGRAADSINVKVRLGDCTLPGTGNMVPALSGQCVLRVEGLVPNQKFVFAVAAYNSQGKLLGNSIGAATLPLLASMPMPLLSTWAHLAQVAFQTEQYVVAKRACRELWDHYTYDKPGSHNTQDRLAVTGLSVQTLQCSSIHMKRLFLTSIFIETEINCQQGSLCWASISPNGPFIWEKEARLAECERMLVATDLALWLNDGDAAVQAVVGCYGLLASLIFHQVVCNRVAEVLTKCLIVLDENSNVLQLKSIGNTGESILHMIACITYYLSKAYRVLQEPQMATAMMDCGRKLLQEVYDSQIARLSKREHSAINCKRIGLQLKALNLKNKESITPEVAPVTDNENCPQLSRSGDSTMLYDLITNRPLKDAYQELSKLKGKIYFTELAAVLLQRTMEEGEPDLVIKWGQSVLESLTRRDEVMLLSRKSIDGNRQSNKRTSDSAKGNESPRQAKNVTSHCDTKKEPKLKVPNRLVQKMRTEREVQVVEMMTAAVKHRKKQFQLRSFFCQERVWRAHVNYSVAQAHLTLLHRNLDKLHGDTLPSRYSQFSPLFFSLAYTGILIPKNSQPQPSPEHEGVSKKDTSHLGPEDSVTAHKDKSQVIVIRSDDSATEESCVAREDSSITTEEQIDINSLTPTFLLDSLNNAALHLRRSMVLAHRGSHWTYLQYVCRSVWDQSCRITDLLQRAAQLELASPIAVDQLNSAFIPLLVLATDLIIDMVTRLGLWSLYDSDQTEGKLESSLHYSSSLDNSSQVDLRWIRTLVLHTLEHLHENGKWETLAHFALVYNSYTRERYASVITPLLVHAQRRLLDRVSSLGGPAAPQPHHVKTKQITGNEVTYRSYATSQLLSGWSPKPSQQPAATNSSAQHLFHLKGEEMKHAMSLVCVPLDVEDTLSCYREALDRSPHCAQVFQHSRSLALQLLAHTQPGFSIQSKLSQSTNQRRSANLVNFSPVAMPVPNTQPCDLTDEDFSSSDALYRLPFSPDHIGTVIAAYSNSIKYLQANGHDSLKVLALHEMGDLQFYSGNTRAAQSCWSKAIDSALQSSGLVEKWDGVSFGGGSLQQILKHAGLWGCLQAAVLAAKIAQYVLTSDISQRTRCCLLSAHLFKCVLHCSLAQPLADLQYVDHSIGDELLPGIDLFSEPHRLHFSTMVASLNFISYWLFTTGYHIRLLPILALYQYIVGTVCRDVHRTVEAKILKIRALTELCLFTGAVKESVQLAQGTGVPLPHGYHIAKDHLQPVRTFFTNKSLPSNVEALEGLLNCEFAPEACKLYGSTLCLRANLARIELVLALSNTVHGPPAPESVEGESCKNVTNKEKLKHHTEVSQDDEGYFLQTKEQNAQTQTERLTLERIKFTLLEGASSLLHSVEQELPSLSCSEIEKLELEIEIKLLKANLYLQKGHAALSTEMIVSALMLLQTSPAGISGSKPGSKQPTSEHLSAKTGSKQGTQDCRVPVSLYADCPRAIEASERTGVLLWLRCRQALVRSMAALHPDTQFLFPDKNINEEMIRTLQDGLEECARWREVDIQGLLMVEAADLEAKRGRKPESMVLLQDAVTLLSRQTCMSPKACVALSHATLLLSDLSGVQCKTLLSLTQKLLTQQLHMFGEDPVFDCAQMCMSPRGPNNIYLPYLSLLQKATLLTGKTISLGTAEMPPSAQSSHSGFTGHSPLFTKDVEGGPSRSDSSLEQLKFL